MPTATVIILRILIAGDTHVKVNPTCNSDRGAHTRAELCPAACRGRRRRQVLCVCPGPFRDSSKAHPAIYR